MTQLARLRYPFVALVTLLAVLSMAAGVSAKPTFHDHFTDVITELDVCGVVVTLEVTVNRAVTVTESTFKTTGNLRFVYTAADGRSVVASGAGQNTGTITDNGDGTFTMLETYNGIALKVSSPGNGGVVMRMAGFVTVVTTVDENTGEATSDVLVQHGRFDQDSGNSMDCDLFLEALG